MFSGMKRWQCALFSLVVLPLVAVCETRAASVFASGEATVQGGTNAVTDISESTAGYLHVKYATSPFTSSRKAYFQFNLADTEAETNAAATFTVSFSTTNKQHVQLWALNQACPPFGSSLTWNSAQANATNSNALLTTGLFTGIPIGIDLLIPTNNTSPANPYSFVIPRLGDFLFSNTITLVLVGVDDANNNSGGLRLALGQATLTFGAPTNPPPGLSTNYDVYLITGQSNMDGRGQTAELTNALASWTQPQSDVRIYYANPGSSTNYNPVPAYSTGWQSLAPGFSVPPGFSGSLPSGDFGPELAFGRTMADAQPQRHIALIKVTKGGTSLSADWSPTGGYLYSTFTNRVRAALDVLQTGGHRFVVRGLIWHQGESDVSGGAPLYYTNLTAFIQAVRRDLALANLPFVVGEIATNKSEAFRQTQFQITRDIPWVGFASADGLQTYEGTHFITRDVLELGRRFAVGFNLPPAVITGFKGEGTQWLLTSSGLAGAPCRLLGTTNLTVPFSNWTSLDSNTFDSLGRTQFTNRTAPGKRQEYFQIRAD